METALITGGAGFIGSHTADALLKKGYAVRVMDNLEKPVHLKGKPSYIGEDIEFIEGDVRNKADWERALDGVGSVFHFAAYQDYLTDFGKFFHVNTVGTSLLYETAVREKIPLKKVIVASSQAVYGEGRYRCGACDTLHYPDMRLSSRLERGEWDIGCPSCGTAMTPEPSVEARVKPESPYALSKYTQELIALNIGKRYGIPTVILRYSIVQGPRQSFYNAYSGACRIFSLRCLFGKAPIIFEDGLQTRDFVNIEDVVSANMMALERAEDFEAYNIAGGRACTIEEFAGMVAKEWAARGPEVPGVYRYGDTRHAISDIGKVSALGWRPINGPEKSVADYRAWLMSGPEALEEVLEYSEKKMLETDVLRVVLKGGL